MAGLSCKGTLQKSTEQNNETINIITDSPIIVLDDEQIGLTSTAHTEIYADGTVKNSIFRPTMPPDIGPATVSRQWHLTDETLNALIQLIKDKYNGLNESYTFPDIPEENKDLSDIDQKITLTIHFDSLDKKVTATGYRMIFSSYIGPHLDIPSPLNEIYLELGNLTYEFEKEFTLAKQKIVQSNLETLEIIRYSTGEKIVLKRNDPRFNDIQTFLLNAVVQKVTNKTAILNENGITQTVSVTVPYALGYILTAKFNDNSEICFNYESENIWYETEENHIFQVTSVSQFGNLLDSILIN